MQRSITQQQQPEFPTKIKLRFTTPKKPLDRYIEVNQNLNIYETPNNKRNNVQNGLNSHSKFKKIQTTCSNNPQLAFINSSNGKILFKNQNEQNFNFSDFSISKERDQNIIKENFVAQKSSDYSSENLNMLLGSDMKFKSPSKLVEIKISESPWISNQKRNNFLSQFFENSPESRQSGYKIGFSERTASKEMQILRPGKLESNFYGSRKFSNDFELRPVLPEASSSRGRGMGQIQISEYEQIKKSQNFEDSYRDDMSNHESSCNRSRSKKRRRKTSQQLKILKNFFEKDQNWSKDIITNIAKITGLTESQVYKWCWDQKKKIEEDEIENKNGESEINSHDMKRNSTTNELGMLGKRRPFREVNDSRLGYIDKKLKMFDGRDD